MYPWARGCLFVAAVALVSGLRADDQAQARAVVDRAIEAVGGADAIGDVKAGVWKTNGTFKGRPSKGSFHGELPGKFRIDSERAVGGETKIVSRIVDGDKGWTVEDGKATPMTAAEIAGVRNGFYHKQLATTLVPLTDAKTKLSVAGAGQVNDKPVVTVKASREGFPDVLLSFDTQTGLLAKSEMTAKNEAAGKDRKVEIFFAEYKDFGGFKMASRSKTLHDGEPFIETEITDFKAVKSLPPDTFKP
jgi:hypothetical protein